MSECLANQQTTLGPIQVLRNQKGGWVDKAKCLCNHKNHRKGGFVERNKWAIGDQNCEIDGK